MEKDEEKLLRTGLHKYLHISKTDVYISAILSIGFFVLVLFKFCNRILDWGIATSYITWVVAMQLGVMWAILAFAFFAYYDKYERKYDS